MRRAFTASGASSALQGLTTPADGDTLIAGGGRYARVPGAYVSFGFGRRYVWFTGDSLTASGNLVDASIGSQTIGGGLTYQSVSPQVYALMSSNCSWTIGGIAATGGYTAAQILSTHVPTIIANAKSGDVCVVLAGTNGVESGGAAAWTAVQLIHDTLRAAGIQTVAVTLPPKAADNSNVANILYFNTLLKHWAARNNVVVYDLHATLVDPATGHYLAAYLNDNTHPNTLGYQAYGQGLGAVLNSLFAAEGPAPSALVPHNNPVTYSTFAKPLATGGASGSEWGAGQALGTSTFAVAADSNFLGGNCYKLTVGNTDISYGGIFLGSLTMTAGHKYRLGMALSASVAGGGTWRIGLNGSVSNPFLIGITGSMPYNQSFSRFYVDFTIANVPGAAVKLLPAATVAGTTLSIGELTLYDLTAMGVP